MKYEAPQLTELVSSITAIQTSGGKSIFYSVTEAGQNNELSAAYVDWED